MNTRELSAFCAAYEARSISQGAARAFVSPQALSKTIQRLEQELGTPLFVRTHTGIEPTARADRLYRDARQLMALLDPEAAPAAPLCAAWTLGCLDYLTPAFLTDYEAQFPQTPLRLRQAPDDTVDALLRAGDAETGILTGPVDTTFYDAALFTVHRHCAVVPRDHPLARRAALTYEDLSGVPLALAGREFRAYHNLMHRFLLAGVRPRVVLEAGEIASVHSFAAGGQGVGISVDFQAMANPYDNTVVLPFADPACTWETCFVTPRDRAPSPAADQLRRFAMAWLEAHRGSLFPSSGKTTSVLDETNTFRK